MLQSPNLRLIIIRDERVKRNIHSKLSAATSLGKSVVGVHRTFRESWVADDSVMGLYAATTFLGAFLLFSVQPLIAKQILPWFGGSAAIWATCLVFFQLMLLAGYAYADLTTRRLAPVRQIVLHVTLLAVSLLTLPVIPAASWKPVGDQNPSWRILGLLSSTIGVPYFLLSTTGPLVQAWWVRRVHHAIPYRLFALSNLASLLALLAYPVLIEPWVPTTSQSMAWSVGYGLFVIMCGYGAAASRRSAPKTMMAVPVDAKTSTAVEPAPIITEQLTWLALAAMASFLLLAVTNHICQNITSLPFLWIAPLSLYLVTFVLCFDRRRWYRRYAFLVLAGSASALMAWNLNLITLRLVIPIYLAGLFVCCMFCHGELAGLKPAPRYLTKYYLMISLGGAIGGLLVGIVAPYVLNGYFELAAGLVACTFLVLYRAWPIRRWAVPVAAAVAGITLWGAGSAIKYEIAGVRVMKRNFYTALKIRDEDDPTPFRSLLHGGIVHGGQLLNPELRLKPTSYFGLTSGYGRLFLSLPDAPRKVGVIGLGAGSLIAYARKGDTFRFYEINPQVIELAKREFTFISATPATIEIVLGDGRLKLEGEPSHQFDVLAMDAFSGDSIPVHLLTKEAMQIYLRHLKPGGVLVFQATNRYLNIVPVVAKLAADFGLGAVLISDKPEEDEDGPGYWTSRTDQILVTANRALFNLTPIAEAALVLSPEPGLRTWTDDFSNLFSVLKW